MKKIKNLKRNPLSKNCITMGTGTSLPNEDKNNKTHHIDHQHIKNQINHFYEK